MSITREIHNRGNLTPEQYGAADGWRLLYVEETIPPDAEYYSPFDARWHQSGDVGTTQEPIGADRRTRAPDPFSGQAGGWIKMSERKPTEDMHPVWYCFKGGRVELRYELCTIMASHWMPANIPTPPGAVTQAQKDEAAFTTWCHRNRVTPGDVLTGAAHRDGIAYEREEIARLLAEYDRMDCHLDDFINGLRARVKGHS